MEIFENLKKIVDSAQFCRHQFVFAAISSPLKGRIHRCATQTKTNIFLLFMGYVGCHKMSTLRRLTLRGVDFFELKIRIYSRKRIFQQNHFSLFISGPGGLDSYNKKMPKNLVTLPP